MGVHEDDDVEEKKRILRTMYPSCPPAVRQSLGFLRCPAPTRLPARPTCPCRIQRPIVMAYIVVARHPRAEYVVSLHLIITLSVVRVATPAEL